MKKYKFDELTDKVKDKILDSFRYKDEDSIQFEFDYIEDSLSDLKDIHADSLKPIRDLLDKDMIRDIEFSDYSLGNYNGSDYAKFNYWIDTDKLIDKILKDNFSKRKIQLVNHLIDDAIIEYQFIKDRGSKYFYIDYSLATIRRHERLTNFTAKIIELIESRVNNYLELIDESLSNYVISSYQSQLEFIQSDEYIIEIIQANEYEFYDNGEIA